MTEQQTHRSNRLQHILSLLLIITVAILLAWLSQRYDKTFDWTATGRHSLSGVSIDVLKQAEHPLTVTAYASDNVELRALIREFIARFQTVKDDISLQFVNPIAVPDEVRNKGITVDGELILEYQGRVQHVKADQETLFINALQKLIRGSEKWLAVVEGHGERKAHGEANHDLGLWVSQLEARGFKAQAINLAKQQDIPDNTSVLLLSAPLVDYLPGEVARIAQYIDNGGNVLWLLEPGSLRGLEPLADYLGLDIFQGRLIDYFGQLLGIDDPTISIATEANYQMHDSLEGFTLTTLFPSVVALGSGDEEQFSITPLIASGEHTWMDVAPVTAEIVFDESQDTLGPHVLMQAMSRAVEDKEQRVVISGDGDFLSNTYIGNSGNMDLGVRLLNWLSGDDELINIPPRLAEDVHLELSNTAKIIIIVSFWLLLPLFFFVTGITVWWRRRRL